MSAAASRPWRRLEQSRGRTACPPNTGAPDGAGTGKSESTAKATDRYSPAKASGCGNCVLNAATVLVGSIKSWVSGRLGLARARPLRPPPARQCPPWPGDLDAAGPQPQTLLS